MMERIALLVDYFRDYETVIANDEIGRCMLDSMLHIETLDKILMDQYNADLLERIHFYEYIYHSNVFKSVLEECKDEPSLNGFIYNVLFVCLFKISILNMMIDDVDQSTLDPSDQLLFASFIETRLRNQNMIEYAMKHCDINHEIYPLIVELLKNNEHVYV